MKRVEGRQITVDVAKFRHCEISSYPGNSWHQRSSFIQQLILNFGHWQWDWLCTTPKWRKSGKSGS